MNLSGKRNITFIQKYLQSTYFLPGIVFGARSTVVNKTYKVYVLNEVIS